jgi:hypothetical protein
MGCDIHGVFQKKDGNKWVDVPSTYDMNRHYQLFAVLAGVRNGYGFAGVPTGDAIVPISEPRGLPDDFEGGETHPLASVELMAPFLQEYHTKDEPIEVWMGYHSHSWLTGAEMLSWLETAPIAQKMGVISLEQYEKWDHKSAPEEYGGGVSGPGVQVYEQAVWEHSRPKVVAANPYIRVKWHSPLREELSYFFNEIARLQSEHGEIRFVFGFDS